MAEKMIKRLLIANRGEIACRIIRTCRELGVETVAVYSDADAGLPHVRMADQAIRLGPAAARESYLLIDRVIAAAQESGADAIHPGYGFLSENADFAEACEAAGIIFVGPPASAIRLMGDKAAARQHMLKNQVPVLPGHDRPSSAAELEQAAAEVGFPLLIKAVAGGGGKGMRIVNEAAGFAEALAAAQREARAAFADDRVLLERYLPRARHVEVQVFADSQGNAVHLFERDCSVQRRHQKVIEEAPAPGVDAALRARLGDAAVQAARAIDYRGAGTVEFLLAPDGEFFFMEMNTRLQVEHPVTELITGEDLVAWQLAVASGEPLPKQQQQLQIQGHAMEVRLYAEDPARDFMPSSGTLSVMRWPEQPGLRVDTGFNQGDLVSDHYDPMLAKVICFGDNREQARRRLTRALKQTDIAGIRHNAGFLARVLEQPAFVAADLSTRFLEEHPLEANSENNEQSWLAAAALIWRDQTNQGDDPWTTLTGWQGTLPARFTARLGLEGENHTVTLLGDRTTPILVLDDQQQQLQWQPSDGGGRLTFEQQPARVFRGRIMAQQLHLFCDGESRSLVMQPSAAASQRSAVGAAFAAPMSGTVVTRHIEPGTRVEADTAVITMEAMKMEHTLRAPSAGVVHELPYADGDTVSEGTLLVVFEADGEETE